MGAVAAGDKAASTSSAANEKRKEEISEALEESFATIDVDEEEEKPQVSEEKDQELSYKVSFSELMIQ